MKLNGIIALGLAAGLNCAGARADEFAIKLKPGPGAETVQNNCSACHSLDYILMNSPFPDAKVWSAEVAKMIAAFGAQINEADAKTIGDYLARNYGG